MRTKYEQQLQDELGDWHATFPGKDAAQVCDMLAMARKERDALKTQLQQAQERCSFMQEALKQIAERCSFIQEALKQIADPVKRSYEMQTIARKAIDQS